VSETAVTAVTAVTVQVRGLPQESRLPIESVTGGKPQGRWRLGRPRLWRGPVTVSIGNRGAIGNRLTCEVTAVTAVTDPGDIAPLGG